RVLQAKRDHRAAKCCQPLEEIASDSLRDAAADAVEAFQRTAIILAWIVQRSQDAVIPLNQSARLHLRREIERTVGIVAGEACQEPPLTSQPPPKLSVRRSSQDADHRQRNSSGTDKIDLFVEDVVRVVIEADNEAAHHLHAVTLHFANAV